MGFLLRGQRGDYKNKEIIGEKKGIGIKRGEEGGVEKEKSSNPFEPVPSIKTTITTFQNAYSIKSIYLAGFLKALMIISV